MSDQSFSYLTQGNKALREGSYNYAIELYNKALQINSALKEIVEFNIEYATLKLDSANGLPTPVKPIYFIHDGAGGMVHTSKDLMNYVSKTSECFMVRAGLKKWELSRSVKGNIGSSRVLVELGETD